MAPFIKKGTTLVLILVLSLSATSVALAAEGSVTVRGSIQGETLAVSQVTYIANGGTGHDYIDSKQIVGKTYKILSPETIGFSKSGYTFVNWNTMADGAGIAYYPNDAVTLNGDMTLYAQWEMASAGGTITTDPKPTDPGTTSTVKTGDTGNITLWYGILCLSFSLIILLLCLRRGKGLNETTIHNRKQD